METVGITLVTLFAVAVVAIVVGGIAIAIMDAWSR